MKLFNTKTTSSKYSTSRTRCQITATHRQSHFTARTHRQTISHQEKAIKLFNINNTLSNYLISAKTFSNYSIQENTLSNYFTSRTHCQIISHQEHILKLFYTKNTLSNCVARFPCKTEVFLYLRHVLPSVI